MSALGIRCFNLYPDPKTDDWHTPASTTGFLAHGTAAWGEWEEVVSGLGERHGQGWE